MCVPYSFVVTAKGEIVDGKNKEHHTDICSDNGLQYDHVLKPEYQIWDRELKDVDKEVHYDPCNEMQLKSTHPRVFYKHTDSGLFLRNKYVNLIENHVKNKFSDWNLDIF